MTGLLLLHLKPADKQLKVSLVFCTSDHLHYQVNRQQVATHNRLLCKVGFCPTDPKLPQKCHDCPEIAALAADAAWGHITNRDGGMAT